MSKPKLIIMVSAPLTNRWATHFCTDELSASFDLEYWDCSLVVYPPFKGIPLERDYVRTPADWREFKHMVRTLPKDTLIMSDIHLVQQNIQFHRFVSRHFKNRVYVNFWSNDPSQLFQNPEIAYPRSMSFKHWLYQCGWLQVVAKFIRFAGDERFKQFYAHYKELKEIKQFVNAEKQCENMYINHIISCLPHQQYSINHPDYEKYLKIKDDKRCLPYKYVVFVDEYYPYHPDFKEINPAIDCDALAITYYETMNHMFDLIEKDFGLKVVIAAHPMADYSHNPFKNREVIMYQTAELIRDSEAVAMHHGFCISYIALFNKPMCFITNVAIRGSKYCAEHVQINAQAFGLPMIDSDKLQTTKNLFVNIPKQKRDEYLNAFFDMNQKEMNAELLTKYLHQIYDKCYSSRK